MCQVLYYKHIYMLPHLILKGISWGIYLYYPCLIEKKLWLIDLTFLKSLRQ